MQIITRIQIKYFRSIYTIDFKDISSTVTVLTGKNDVGKSNVLRALNLFFNNEVDYEDFLDFDRDFSKIKKKEIKERSKERQLISIELEFKNPGSYRSLPKFFACRKSWDRYGKMTELTWRNIEGKKKAFANRFLNQIEYTYIPAIKDRDTFSQLLEKLKSNLPKPATIKISEFNKEIEGYGDTLKKDLSNSIGLTPTLTLPTSIKELFSSMDFAIEDGVISTSLSQRGDGIRCRFIPAILNYISQNSTKKHIWGLEEPENSLEFANAINLEKTIENDYAKRSQIFISSHSPAFVGDIGTNSKKVIYFLTRNIDGSVSSKRIDKSSFHNKNSILLGEELGYIQLQNDLYNILQTNIKEAEDTKVRLNRLLETIDTTKQKLILCVEGESDEILLKTAWLKLKGNQNYPFFIHTCFGFSQIRVLLSRSELCLKSPNKIFVGLFDFDSAYNDWNGLKPKNENWVTVNTNIKEGLLKTSSICAKYGLLLPVHDEGMKYIHKTNKGQSVFSIELLFEDIYLTEFAHENEHLGGVKLLEMDKTKKISFAKKSKDFPKEAFVNFGEIFSALEKIKNNDYENRKSSNATK